MRYFKELLAAAEVGATAARTTRSGKTYSASAGAPGRPCARIRVQGLGVALRTTRSGAPTARPLRSCPWWRHALFFEILRLALRTSRSGHACSAFSAAPGSARRSYLALLHLRHHREGVTRTCKSQGGEWT